ncbi:MAG: 3'-5' exonuclease [Eubacteriales bacterium]
MVNNYVVIDLETTGLKPKEDRIIEIGAVKVCEGAIVDTFQSYVNPAMKISELTQSITHIKQAELDKAEYIEDILEEFFDYLEDVPIVGHNILFDYSFLKKVAVQNQYTFDKCGIDTLQLSRKYIPQAPSKKLESMCDFFRIQYTPHRALEDAMATYALYQKMSEYCQEVRQVAPTPLYVRFKKEAVITKQQIERLEELIQRYQIQITYDVNKLTKNQASRYTDQILATYGR